MKLENKDRMILWTLANLADPPDRDGLLDAIVRRGQEFAVNPLHWRSLSPFELSDRLRHFVRDGLLTVVPGDPPRWYFSNRNQRDGWQAAPIQISRAKEKRRVMVDADAAREMLAQISAATAEFDRAYEALKTIRKTTKALRESLA